MGTAAFSSNSYRLSVNRELIKVSAGAQVHSAVMGVAASPLAANVNSFTILQ